jgi:PAS domain S-box-containing protein
MTADELKEMLIDSPVGFSILRGRELVFELVNATYAELSGRTVSELTGRPYRKAFPELEGSGTFEMIEGVFDSGRGFSMREYKVRLSRDGAMRDCYFDFSVQPTRAPESGTITGLVGIAMDVTELVTRRREAEAMAERLKESEERFRGAQETSLDAFMALRSVRDAQGRVVDFDILFQNEAGTRINGVDVSRSGPRRMLEAFPGLPSTALWKHYLHTAETGEPFRVETPYQQDGLDGWFRIVGSKVGEGIALTFSDITEKKRMEQSEREARQRAEFLAADIEQQCRDMEVELLRVRSERDAALAKVEELQRTRAV